MAGTMASEEQWFGVDMGRFVEALCTPQPLLLFEKGTRLKLIENCPQESPKAAFDSKMKHLLVSRRIW